LGGVGVIESLQGLLGIGAIVALSWAVSENRRVFDWRSVLVGLALQFGLALLLLKLPLARRLFLALNEAVLSLERATREGAGFVFGYLGGAPLPFATEGPGTPFVLAFQALPLILVMSALSALLWHWRILPLVVKTASRVLERLFGIGGAVEIGRASCRERVWIS